MAQVTFMTNDEWASPKGYTSFALYTADNNPKPNSTQLDFFRETAFGMMLKRIGSTTFLRSDLTAFQQLEYRGYEYLLVEKLRLKEVVKKSKDLSALQKEIESIISMIPQEEAADLNMDADDNSINRGAVEG